MSEINMSAANIILINKYTRCITGHTQHFLGTLFFFFKYPVFTKYNQQCIQKKNREKSHARSTTVNDILQNTKKVDHKVKR